MPTSTEQTAFNLKLRPRINTKQNSIVVKRPISCRGTKFFRIPAADCVGRKTLCAACPCFGDGILKIANFPQPVPQPNQPNSYSIKYINDTIGLGVFSTRKISAADIILAERPLFVASVQTSSYWRKSQLDRIMKPGQNMLENFEPAEQEIYLSLKSAHGDLETSNPFFSRFFTNLLPMSGLKDHVNSNEGEIFGAICEEASRLNHSCSPNAICSFDAPSFSMIIRATRFIKPGEEITISYCNVMEPAASRQQILQAMYNFTCTCPSCSSPKKSDARRERIVSFNYNPNLPKWVSNPRVPDDHIITSAHRRLKIIRQEGIELCEQHVAEYIRLYQSYSAMADLEKCEEYMKEWRKALLICGKPANLNEEAAKAFKRLDANPEKNLIWGKRLELYRPSSSKSVR